jgi:DNA-binding transcriptional LysR family regulator
MKNFDIKLLRSFVAVARTCSMTSAAGETRQTQGAISQQVKRLELLLGQKLFIRSGQGVTLTACGDELLSSAKEIIASCDGVLARFQPTQAGKVVRFGMPYDLVAAYLSRTLDQFSAAFPDVDVELHCDASPALKEMVDAGELDLAMIEEPLSACEGVILRVEQLVWIGKSGGKAHAKRPLPISLVAETCVFRPSIIEALNVRGLAWRTVFQNGNLDATMATVKSDMSVTAGLRSLVPIGLEALTDEADLPELPNFVISLYPTDRQVRSSVRELFLTIQRAFGQAS